MASYEPDESMSCSDCGAAVATDQERLYAFGTDGVLCMECALRRGGAWDEGRDRWTVPPRVDDLLGRYDAEAAQP
jgi:hypothetical protein